MNPPIKRWSDFGSAAAFIYLDELFVRCNHRWRSLRCVESRVAFCTVVNNTTVNSEFVFHRREILFRLTESRTCYEHFCQNLANSVSPLWPLKGSFSVPSHITHDHTLVLFSERRTVYAPFQRRLPGCRHSHLGAVVNMRDSLKMHSRRHSVSYNFRKLWPTQRRQPLYPCATVQRKGASPSVEKVASEWNAESLEIVRYVVHKRVTPLVLFNALKHAPSSSSMLQFLHCDFNVRTWRYVGLQNALPIPLFRMRRSTFWSRKQATRKCVTLNFYGIICYVWFHGCSRSAP